LAPRAQDAGAAVISLDKPPGTHPLLIGRLRKLFTSLRPDVVHTHQIGALFYAGPAARHASVQAVVHTEHGKHYATRWRTRLLGRLAGRYAQRFLCVSNDIAREVRARRIVPPAKVHFAANGIDLAPFATAQAAAGRRAACGIDADAFVVGTVGRLAEVKRQDLLLAAFAEFKKSTPRSHLLIVGDGPWKDRLARLAAKLQVADSVYLAGYQERPEDWLGLMDVFCLTSRSEGMPLGVLEAWAARVPVVASAVGGLPDLVQHGRTGLLVPFEDTAALVSAWRRLCGDPQLRDRLSEAGAAEVTAEFSLGAMLDRYQAHYREVLGQTAGARA
jgi:glycosyltransferase involved in cell wall biosynthesis